MPYKTILSETLADGVGVVRLNRPQALNRQFIIEKRQPHWKHR